MLGSGMAEALSVNSSKVMRKDVVPTLPPPMLHVEISLAPKSIVQPVSGTWTVVSAPTAKSDVLKEKTFVRELRSSNCTKSVGVRLPASRCAVIVRKFIPLASSARRLAPQPLSLPAVPATVIEVAFCVMLPTQLVSARTEPEPAVPSKEDNESELDGVGRT